MSSFFCPDNRVIYIKCMQKDVSAQAVQSTKVSSSQTVCDRKAVEITQYTNLKLEDFGLCLDEMWAKVASFVRKVSPLIEWCLQENKTFDISSDYLNVSTTENVPNSVYPEEENAGKDIRNFTDLDE